MGQEDDGLPLREAILAWGDPALERALQVAIMAVPAWDDGIFPPLLPWHEDALLERRKRLLEAVYDARRARTASFKGQLARGELAGSGWEAAPTSGRGRRAIEPELWPHLELDIEASSARGPGLELLNVRVRLAPATCAGPAVGQPSPEPLPRATSATPPQRPRGRPSVMGEIREEMIRRHAAGQLLDGIAAECRALEGWARHNIHDDRIPVADSIEEALRPLYRELRGEKK